MKIKCKKCLYIWSYTGKKKPNKKFKVYIACPKCHTSTLLEEYYPERICVKVDNIVTKYAIYVMEELGRARSIINIKILKESDGDKNGNTV